MRTAIRYGNARRAIRERGLKQVEVACLLKYSEAMLTKTLTGEKKGVRLGWQLPLLLDKSPEQLWTPTP
ncbi:MAG: hypothetical protein ABSA41_17035 [Terriglobia bacterium]